MGNEIPSHKVAASSVVLEIGVSDRITKRVSGLYRIAHTTVRLIMTTKASLIFNPTAGQNDPVSDLVTIREVFESKINLDIYPSHKGVSTTELTHQAIKQGAQMILIAGGDGTISSAVEALIGTDIPIGIIPRGTVNAFAQALNIPIDVKAACEAILLGKPNRVDAAICNGKPMIVLTGIGLEPETISSSSRRIKKRFGMLSFVLAGIKQLGELKSFEAWIETENGTINSQAVAVTIANTAAPTSLLAHGPANVIPDDGLLDVTIFAPSNRTNAFFGAYHLLRSGFTDDATNRDDIQYLKAKNVKVKTKPLQKVSLDGDPMEATVVEVTCVPGSLNILLPALDNFTFN
jgi:YegS/Rv2252/BmrU family lipid kinase